MDRIGIEYTKHWYRRSWYHIWRVYNTPPCWGELIGDVFGLTRRNVVLLRAIANTRSERSTASSRLSPTEASYLDGASYCHSQYETGEGAVAWAYATLLTKFWLTWGSASLLLPITAGRDNSRQRLGCTACNDWHDKTSVFILQFLSLDTAMGGYVWKLFV